MESVVKLGNKAKQSTKKLLHLSDKARKHESDLERNKGLSPIIDIDRGHGPSQNINYAVSMPSPDSRQDQLHEPQVHLVEARDTARQPVNNYPNSLPKFPIEMEETSHIPWEAWRLDQDFLNQVYVWNTKHRNDNLSHVFNNAIERHQVLFELIPDGPVPIRGFVKALAHVVNLGISISNAKATALQFVRSVLHWVEKLAAAFRGARTGHFIEKAWDNLEEIRGIIEKVCAWGHKTLNIGLTERASVNDKILEFQEEFKAATERFGVISNTQITIDNDRFNQHLEIFNKEQNHMKNNLNRTNHQLNRTNHQLNHTNHRLDRANHLLKGISQAQSEQNYHLDDTNRQLKDIRQTQSDTNDHLDHTNHHIKAISQNLVQHMAQKPAEPLLPQMPDATYRSQKKSPCDPGTRKEVMDEIMNWISDTSKDSPNLCWLSGEPGVGKSAVTVSVAKECKGRDVLWAQLFINCNDAQTVDPQLYFLSIANQMSASAHAVEHAVRKTLESQQYLLNDDLSDGQATKLFGDTIRVASAATPSLPVAIVIDALDESDGKRLRETAKIISDALVDLPPNAKIFISSRVEDVIRDNFTDHPRIMNIHLSTKNSTADVNQFLETKILRIMSDYHIPRSDWGDERMEKLCSQASGLFIWAVTAIAYIRSEIEESGKEGLDTVLDELNANGMGDIYTLYRTILKRIYKRKMDPWHIQRFRRIIGAILVHRSPLTIADIESLLDLQNPQTKSPVHVEHFVRRHRTLLVAGVREINGRTLPRVHKSFADFLTCAEAEDFRVDLTESNGELALQSINRLLLLWEDVIPTQLR